MSNTAVKVKLVKHHFLFGCGAFDSIPATSDADIVDLNDYQVDEWHTEAELKTDSEGKLTLNGFKGEYELEIGGKIIKFSNNESCEKEIILTV